MRSTSLEHKGPEWLPTVDAQLGAQICARDHVITSGDLDLMVVQYVISYQYTWDVEGGYESLIHTKLMDF